MDFSSCHVDMNALRAFEKCSVKNAPEIFVQRRPDHDGMFMVDIGDDARTLHVAIDQELMASFRGGENSVVLHEIGLALDDLMGVERVGW